MRRLLLNQSNIGIHDPTKLLEEKSDTIAHFVKVVVPLQDVYQLPPTSVHIFYDCSGSTVAFSCNAGIFLNLRYYEVWRMYYFLA